MSVCCEKFEKHKIHLTETLETTILIITFHSTDFQLLRSIRNMCVLNSTISCHYILSRKATIKTEKHVSDLILNLELTL